MLAVCWIYGPTGGNQRAASDGAERSRSDVDRPSVAEKAGVDSRIHLDGETSWSHITGMTNDGAALWARLLGDPRTMDVVHTHGDPVFASSFDVTGFARDAVSVATLAAAELFAVRSDQPVPRVDIGSVESAAAFRSEALFEAVGWERPPVWDPIAGDYRTRDRWIRLHTNYAPHRRAALEVLAIPDASATRAVLEDAVESWDGVDIEQAIVTAGGCAAVMYSRDEWLSHEHGYYAKEEPPISIEQHPIEPRTAAAVQLVRQAGEGALPLAGLRVLDLTRVLAGPVCTRFLAAHGANVLRLDPPGFEEVPAVLPETTVGKRCAFLGLDTSEGKAKFSALLEQADVLVHGLRPGALAKLGFDDATLSGANRSMVVATVDAYGWNGPWRARRGFDSLVQMSTGIAADSNGPEQKPRPLPAQALDHGAGYLLAAGVLRALTERVRTGRPSTVRASLVGIANHLYSRPRCGALASHAARPTDLLEPRRTFWGAARSVPCPGRIGGRPTTWTLDAGPLGTSPPSFA